MFSFTALMSLIDAALGGEIDKIKQIIAAGAEVNQAGFDGWTPLNHATKNVSAYK